MKEGQEIKPESEWEPDHELNLNLTLKALKNGGRIFRRNWSEHSCRCRGEARVGDSLVGEDPLGSCCDREQLMVELSGSGDLIENGAVWEGTWVAGDFTC